MHQLIMWIISQLVGLALMFGVVFPQTPLEPLTNNPLISILCYHHVGAAKPNPYNVTIRQFVEHIDALEKAGFKFVSLDQIYAFYYKHKPLPPKSVAITFDDGNLNVYQDAFPILTARKIPWALFIYPTYTNQGHRRRAIAWHELRDLQKHGVTLGSHSYYHPFLTFPKSSDGARNLPTYKTWLQLQTKSSKEYIEQELQTSCNYFAVPFGAEDQTVLNEITKAGYLLSFNVNGNTNDKHQSPLNLNRIIVLPTHSAEHIVDMCSVMPLPLQAQNPPDLSRTTSANLLISFQLPKSFKETVVKVQVSGLGMATPHYNQKTKTWSMPYTLKRPGLYVVKVIARDTQQIPHVGSWIFVYNRETPYYLKE